jgi:HEAT repeat protein
MRRVLFLLFILAVLLTLAGLGWWQRTPLLAWYCVRGLASAEEEQRQTWIARVCSLDAAAVPSLVACLHRENPQACANVQLALASLLDTWGSGDARTLALAEQISQGFPGMSAAGQQAALETEVQFFKGAVRPQGPAAQAAVRMLAAVKDTDALVHARALALAEMFMDSPGLETWAHNLSGMVRAGLKSPDPRTRIRAAHLTLHATLGEDHDTRAQVIPLLRDPDALVRRAALLALGMDQTTVSDEILLPLLHDEDAEVRRLCEGALRSRGLNDEHLLLARLISDHRPSARLQVLEHLAIQTDLEPGAWLRRLSQDPVPAVRAAAVRAAAGQNQVDLTDRLRQLAHDDPSPTVRQLAGHYAELHFRTLAGRP